MAIALKTGSAQAAQLGFLLFFPLLFLSPAFAPKDFFAGWLKFLATINPVTYILAGHARPRPRRLGLRSRSPPRFASIAGLGVFTMTLVLLALRSRTA